MKRQDLFDDVKERIALSSDDRLPPDSRYRELWDALLACANANSEADDEKIRLAELVKNLDQAAVRSILELEDLKKLIDLDPPLESELAPQQPHEKRQTWSSRHVQRLRKELLVKPESAILSLGFVLTGIRNKCAHGLKTPRIDRNREILGLALPVLRMLCEKAVERLENTGRGPNSSGYRVRVSRLGKEQDDDLSSSSPAERLMMVWDLSETAWTFTKGRGVEPRLRRDVVRVVRRGG
jgi:hypothetical protein